MNRNVNIIVGSNGEKMVLIYDIRFKGKRKEEWKEIENYLKSMLGGFMKLLKPQKNFYIK